MPRSTTATRPRSRGLAPSGSVSPSWPKSIRHFGRISMRATPSSRSSKISPQTLRAYRRDDRRVARPSAGGRGPARASREAQAEARTGARRRHREAGRALAPARRSGERRRAARGSRGRDARREGRISDARSGAVASTPRGGEAVRHPNSGSARRAGDGAHAVRRAIRGGAARDRVDRGRRGRGRVLSVGERRGRHAAARAHRQRRRALARDARDQDAGRGLRSGQDADLRRDRCGHRRTGCRRRRGRSSAASASRSRCYASRIFRKSPPPAMCTSISRRASRTAAPTRGSCG